MNGVLLWNKRETGRTVGQQFPGDPMWLKIPVRFSNPYDQTRRDWYIGRILDALTLKLIDTYDAYAGMKLIIDKRNCIFYIDDNTSKVIGINIYLYWEAL